MTFNYFFLALIIVVPLIGVGILLFRNWRENGAQRELLIGRVKVFLRNIAQRINDFFSSPSTSKTGISLAEKPIDIEEIDSNSEGGSTPPGQKTTVGSEEFSIEASTNEKVDGNNSLIQSSTAEKFVRVHITTEIPVGSIVKITITTGADNTPVTQQEIITPVVKPETLFARITSKLNSNQPANPIMSPVSAGTYRDKFPRLNSALFILALIVYIITRFTDLPDFPIYFFSDEAIQTVSAADLISHNWKGPNNEFLPTYFQNGTYYNLSASVYAQVIPFLLFGKSVWVTRGTSALITLLAALVMGLILRDIFKISRWWLGPLILAISPAWFLHSRTAFETAIFVSFYATYIYFYLLYRLRSPNYLYLAVIMAGLAFYSYSPGQLVLAVTSVLLFILDFKYHMQNRAILFRALGVLIILALPYLRSSLTVPYSPLDHLRQLDSYWIHPIPLSEKILTYIGNYLYGLSPQYWFIPNSVDLTRHQMKDYGHLLWWTFPLFVLGIIIALRQIKNVSYRTILIALCAAPTGGALASIGITRVLVFVIPASLLIAIGLNTSLDWILDRLAKSNPRFSQVTTQSVISIFLFLFMAGFSFAMLRDALTNGPTWFQDYGLYGMQYGSRQIFEQTVLPLLRKDSNARFMISPSWANGTEEFTSFFIPQEYQSRVRLGQIYDLIKEKPVLGTDYYFVVTQDELDKIQPDPKFKDISTRSVINLPNGKPGFYVINLAFADNLDAIWAQQQAELQKPVEDFFEWHGENVRVIHSPLSGGQMSDLTDANSDTLAKSLDINPFFLEFFFTHPIPTSSLDIQTGSMANFTVTIRLYAPGKNEPVEYSQNFKDLPPDPVVTLLFPNGPVQADHIYISVKDNLADNGQTIHIREITIK